MKYDHHLYKYISHKKMTPAAFAESLGLQRTDRLYNVLKGKNGLSVKFAKLISDTYNDVSYDWLLTGEGEMIKMEGKSLDDNFRLNEPEAHYKNNTVTPIPTDNYMEVEFRDLSVAAGPLNMVDEKAPKRTMLVPSEYDRGEYLVVRVDGPSMYDGSIYSIPEGANILIKRYYLENGDKLPIRDNLFVIDAKDGQALKQIVEHNTEEGYIICHSYNPEFNDYRVDLEDVFDFYIFRKIVGFRPPVRGI